MSSGPATRPRFHALDSLRGVCACTVVLYHFQNAGWISSAELVRQGWSFVDFFFVLSGFVIASSYRDRIGGGYAVWRFMALRVGRIWPMHALMMLAFLLWELSRLALGDHGGDHPPLTGTTSLGSLLPCLFLLQVPLDYLPPMWNGPSWSISAELWTYLLFGLLFRLPRVAFLMLTMLMMAIAAAQIAQHPDGYMFRFDQTALYRCVIGFGLGVLAAELRGAWPAERRLPRVIATAVELAAVAAVIGAAIAVGETVWVLVMPLVFVAAVLVFSAERGLVSRLLLTAPLRGLGALSYSIYITHLFFVFHVPPLLGKLVPGLRPLLAAEPAAAITTGGRAALDLLTLALLAGVIVFSWLTHRLVEMPVNEWTRRRFGGRRADPEAVEAPAF